MQFINNYRGIAILLIVLIHAIGTINNDDSAILHSLGLLLDNSTILFVVVAGYLFSSLSTNFNYLQYLKHKFKIIIIPYFFFSLPAIFIYMSGLKSTHFWIDMDWINSLSFVSQYLYFMVSGAHLVTLWFIPMIIPLYLFSPAMLYAKNKKILGIFFLVSLIPALWFGRPEFSVNNAIWTVYFLPTYLLGMLLWQQPRIYEKLAKYSGLILFSYIVVYLWLSWDSAFSTSVDLLWKMALSVILIAFSKRHLAKKNKCLNMFARLSFYLYFVHGYFIAAFRILYTQYFSAEMTGLFAASASFVLTLLFTLASFVMIKLILHEKSKIFIGL
ncbi:acyltransferase [Moritella sp. Urea-trap-13]|uniref:acyltransferase family protein n=1 Tax=Moritella sp. Urea-trap-13 TaxID=2058327 RepID=UPI000C320B9A|nr:acyltransferase [Moritella sp. Urea-trap-13]PKH06771.1 acyltransferase [Moritella sp. Urea-trap-13]